MSLKSQIENAKDAVSKALITALQDKNETAISDLFDAYNKLVSIQITETNKNLFTINTSNTPASYYNSSMSDDVISFTGLG
jgi:myosin heavy subunit